MKRMFIVLAVALLTMNASGSGCMDEAGRKDSLAQEQLMLEAQAQAGMPAIHNFQEKKLLKMILELRDQENLATWVYLQSSYTGKLTYVGRAIGYGIPYSAQYTASTNYYNGRPQPEPNGIYMPDSAEGTWLLMVDPRSEKARPVYFEPRVVVSPFPLEEGE